ncbi:unnamed protein product [Meloidogyne enterolobii]|uniref:Uncharacterized protein n=1 Tax=Meloidogyne enterolobii TaxID=390850 RepID=A0ACB1APF1_MELEN
MRRVTRIRIRHKPTPDFFSSTKLLQSPHNLSLAFEVQLKFDHFITSQNNFTPGMITSCPNPFPTFLN